MLHYQNTDFIETMENLPMDLYRERLAGFVSRSSRVQILGHALYIANWFASSQLGFLTMLCSFKVICFLCFSGMPKLAISKLSA